ncbi:hypothetical protein ACIOHE_39295 [Streptomyces sp. NPDC087851]
MTTSDDAARVQQLGLFDCADDPDPLYDDVPGDLDLMVARG